VTRARIAIAAVALVAVAALGIRCGRTSSSWRSLARSADEAGWAALRITRPQADGTQRIEDPGAPTLFVRRYDAEPPLRGALVLVHGNRAAGGGRAVYRVLSRALARAGWDVWAMDLRGYGASDPAPGGPLRAEDLLGDVRRVTQRLAEAYPERPLGVVGHSIGAIVALQLDLDPRWRIVALEPGVGLHERVVRDGAPDLASFTEKLRRNVRGGVVDRSVVRVLYGHLDPERSRPSPGVRIVQGRHADPELVQGMQRLAAAHDGAELVWTDSRDHEYGVREIAVGAVVPSRVIAEVRDRISEHVAGVHGGAPGTAEVDGR
jgi:pimeloyl-ACP methyl ester carboxylesterase